jgi:hypothetical protein
MDLKEVNQQFRTAYAAAREAIQRTLGSSDSPVLVKLDSDLILYADGCREVVRVLTPRYERLKALCPLPLALALAARHGQATALSVESLRQYCTQAGRALMVERDADLQEVNRQLLDASWALLHDWPCAPETLQAWLVNYAAAVEPLLACNIRAAAADELYGLHRTVSHWCATVLRSTWPRLRVVVCGSPQACYREPPKRYFQALFGETEQAGAAGESRALYGEGVTEEGDALRLLAGHLLDRELEELFRGSPMALQQDVLGAAADGVLRGLLATGGVAEWETTDQLPSPCCWAARKA